MLWELLAPKIEEYEEKADMIQDEYFEGWDAAMDFIEKLIKENEPKWVPFEVSDPPEDGEYIVTIEGATEATTLLWDGVSWCDDRDYTRYSVVAWRELPEAYKEGGA